MTTLNEYVGIPYIPGGRDRAGLDCYGLLRLVLRDMFYVELPEMATGPASPRALSRALTSGTLALANAGHLARIDPDNVLRAPAIVVSWHNAVAVHCGLQLGLSMLHTSPDTRTSVIERLDRYRARSGSLECYQWQP